MERHAKVDVYARDAVFVTAYLKDFDGDVQKWKNAVYELFRYDMTCSFAYKIDVNENRSNGVFVSITAKPAYEIWLMETMPILGFCNAKAQHESIGSIECTELPDDMLFDFAIVDY